MTDAWRTSLNPFAGSPTARTRWIPQISEGLRPAFEDLAVRLDLIKRARDAGVENLPHTADRAPDETQQAIVGKVLEDTNLLRQFCKSQLIEAEKKIGERQLRSAESERIIAEARVACVETRGRHEAILHRACVEAKTRLREWRKFRADNGINRQARYARNPITPWAWLMAILLAETLANASLLLGFLAGRGLSLLEHVRPARRLKGGGLTAFTITAGLVWNFGVAKYREGLEMEGAAGPIDVAHLLAALHLSSIHAIALFVIGIAAFIFAAWKGRGGDQSFHDPYPDYAPIDRDHETAVAIWEAAKEAYRHDARRAVDAMRAGLRQRRDQEEVAAREAREIAAEAAVRVAEVRDSIEEWAQNGEQLLRRYRETNVAIRDSAPPEYFGRYDLFNGLSEQLHDCSRAEALSGQIAAQFQANEAEYAKAEAALMQLAEEEPARFVREIEEIDVRARARVAELLDGESPPAGSFAPPNLVPIRQEQRL
jgi:hypothetical protein